LNPPEFYIDPNDDNLLLGVPDDPLLLQSTNPNNQASEEAKNKENEELSQKQKDKNKIYESRNKITKSLLGRSGVLKDDGNENTENDSNRPACSSSSQQNTNETKNFWNISNDEFYNPKVVTEQQQQVSKNVSTTLVLQHSQAALELRQPFFPTHLSNQKLRNFHRLTLKRYLNGILSNEQMFHQVCCFLKKGYHLNKKSTSLSAAISAATSSGTTAPVLNNELVSIQNAADLSATDSCELILAEYSEQFPPLMMQPGMATKIRNYYKRKFAKDEGPNLQATNYGELVYISSSPFLGALKPGEFLQSLENYMFRAPIYMHKMPEQDFLLIRNRQSGYFIRGDFKNIFVVGQECPLIEVPGPNSKRANSFIKDYLQAYIFRLFHRSRDIPKRIKMEDIRKAFPTHPESSIRKKLKICSDLRRNIYNKNILNFCEFLNSCLFLETDANWWILKEEFRLPTEDEIRQVATPEQCCAFYSMCAAEQRLKDAGYGESKLFLFYVKSKILKNKT
jgi:transcription initiation factor TFIID subunit 1